MIGVMVRITAERRVMGLSIEEQEICVNFMRGDDRAKIYTSDTTIMTKLNKLVELQDSEWKLEHESRLESGEVVGKTYSCPVSLVSFKKSFQSIHRGTKKGHSEETSQNRF